jgi:threonine/homoserine/homoserine lactone efflux protein
MEKALIIGFFLGFIMSSPLGPMGLICLRRTLNHGRIAGLMSALGISCGDAFWSYAAIHGLTTVSHWIEQEEAILEFAIALFFIFYGLHGIFNTPSIDYPTLHKKDKSAGFLSTFLVVFLNPGTFILFALLFTLFGITQIRHDLFDSIEIAASVFSGSIIFWIMFSQVLHKIRKKLNESIYGTISHISSYMITIFGVLILLFCLYDKFFVDK